MGEGYRPWKKQESRESPELFRASLGFDFIFTTDDEGEHRPICVEINGDRSGISGVQQVPKEQIDPLTKTIASIRNEEGDEFKRKMSVALKLQDDINSGVFQASEDTLPNTIQYIENSLKKEQMFKHSFRNPKVIQTIATDKLLQIEVVPEKFQPRTWKPGMSLISSTGAWIAKPKDGIQGRGVHILYNGEIEEHFETSGSEAVQEFVAIQEFIVLQELIQPDGADVALGTPQQNNPASLRLLMDFIYREDGTIEPVYEVAYQRVSPHNPEEVNHGVDPNEVYIVNKARGARAYAASPEEVKVAHEAALEIIQSLARVMRKDSGSEESKL